MKFLKIGIIIFSLTLISISSIQEYAFAQNSSIISEMEEGAKSIQVSGTDFMVSYKIVGGTISNITPEVESKSVIISMVNSENGVLTITLPRSLIDSKMDNMDDVFFVLVDGQEIPEFEEEKTLTERTLKIEFPQGSEQLEIVGTFAVPEFGTFTIMIFAVVLVSIIAISSKSKISILQRF